MRFAVAVDLGETTGEPPLRERQRLLGRFESVTIDGHVAVASFESESAAGGIRDARSLGRRIQRSIRGGRVWIGLAPIRSDDATRATGEARRAIELAKLLSPEPAVVLYDDLLVADMLERDRALCDRLASVLDALIEYDRTHRWVLLATLDAFIDADLSAHATARRLGVHRHTVDYRIRRAESLIGRSATSGKDRILIETALLAIRIAGRKPPPELRRARAG